MSDLEPVLTALAESTRRFIAALDDSSPGEWERRPSAERWSLAQTAEHTVVVLRGIERLCTTRMAGMPLAANDPGRRVRNGDLTRIMSDRSETLPAPAMVLPTGRWATREALIADFRKSTEGLIAWARSCPVDLRSIGAPHPLLGALDAVQWLEFVAAHTDRHRLQVEEIRRASLS